MLKNASMTHHVELHRAVGRGLACRCPRCGIGHLFDRYLKPAARCRRCGERFDDMRTDDIAPYFTILAVGHVIVPLLLVVERQMAPPEWVHWLIWPALATVVTFLALPRIKGAVLGWMWSLGLRGDEQH